MSEYRPRYFGESEFPRCSPSCSLRDMDGTFLESLDKARELSGIPFVINSAFRSREYELSKGRSGASYHTLGRAVDIRCNSSSNRYKIVNALLRVGFKGIGIASTFIHVDNRNVKEPLIWLY